MLAALGSMINVPWDIPADMTTHQPPAAFIHACTYAPNGMLNIERDATSYGMIILTRLTPGRELGIRSRWLSGNIRWAHDYTRQWMHKLFRILMKIEKSINRGWLERVTSNIARVIHASTFALRISPIDFPKENIDLPRALREEISYNMVTVWNLLCQINQIF